MPGKSLFRTFFLIFSVLFFGLRLEVGGDWDSYLSMYQIINRMIDEGQYLMGVEPLYIMLNILSATIGGDIYFVNFVCSSILFLGFWFFCKTFEINFYYFLFLLSGSVLFVLGMGFVRQSAAVGMFLLAVSSIHIGSRKRGLFFFLCSIFFHYSAAFAICLYLFLAFRFKNSLLIALFVFSLGFGVFYNKMGVYSSGQYESSGVYLRLFVPVTLSVFHIVCCSFLNVRRDSFIRIFLHRLAFLYAAFLCLALVNSTIVDRMSFYFSPFTILFFVDDLKRLDGVFRYFFVVVVSFLSFLSFFIWIYFSKNAIDGWLNYKNIILVSL
ncbi:EpsG family protein [Chitinibacter sp. S2-10]|uniref:EpsG family protein n=1 Tax=Chitinibacter sp. S2-10 TaxID=3373597 RepID=UPI0039779725